MSRNIVIYPNRGTTGATEQPYITFSGASAGTINLVVEDDGSLTFDGDTGSLFGISDNKDGLLHSVNDVSGLPIFQVYDNDYLYMGKWDEPTLIVSGQTWNIIGGSGHTINSGVERSAIIGGGNITATTSDTVYVPNFHIKEPAFIHSNIDTIDDTPWITFLGAGFYGPYSSFDNSSFGNGSGSGALFSNANTSGFTGMYFGDLTNYPTTEKYGFMAHYGDDITLAGSGALGNTWIRGKTAIRTSEESSGMTFGLNGSTNPNRTFSWFSNASALMVLHANNENPRLGIGLDTSDADILPDATLQVGSTGSTATLKYVDGNQQSGYVLTSDGDGNATWQASTGGGVSIDAYEVTNSATTITWDVSGTSTNYETTLTGNTTVNLTNVRNGDYGTLIVHQDGTGSHTLSAGTVNGGGGTHKVVNGGGGSISVTATAGATDILTFTYNGNTVWWSVGFNYT